MIVVNFSCTVMIYFQNYEHIRNAKEEIPQTFSQSARIFILNFPQTIILMEIKNSTIYYYNSCHCNTRKERTDEIPA